MTANEYLKQFRFLDLRIKIKTLQIQSLRDLASTYNRVFTDRPRNTNRTYSRVEDYSLRIVELEESLKEDIERLIALKEEIPETIKRVSSPELHDLLEMRYLCYMTWEQIASEMGYSVQHIYRLREAALGEVEGILREREIRRPSV